MVRYLPDQKALFLHIPRTGGTWVQQALGLCDMPVDRWLRRNPPEFAKKHCLIGHYRPPEDVSYVFAFVRHPVSYYCSLWKWCREAGHSRRYSITHRWKWHPKREAILRYDPDVNVFVERVCRERPGYVTRLFEWYVGPEDGEYCQFIGRQESLADDFCRVMHHLQVGFDENAIRQLKPVNASRRTHCPITAASIRLIKRTERLAITRFYDG